MGILRSEPVRHGTLILPAEKARQYVDMIGHRLSLQFSDMNAHDLRRPFRNQIQRLEESERMLRFIFDEIKRANREGEIHRTEIDDFLVTEGDMRLDAVEPIISASYSRLVKLRANNEELESKLFLAEEDLAVVKYAMSSLREPSSEDLLTPLLSAENGLVSTLAGVLSNSEKDRFERTIFRASRGNCFVTVDDSNVLLKKFVFAIFFQGGETTAMREKISRICSAFGANMFVWPRGMSEAKHREFSLNSVVEEGRRAMQGFTKYWNSELDQLLDGHSPVEIFRLFILKEKGLYATLNLFAGALTLRCDCWFPEGDIEKIQTALASAGRILGAGATLVVDAPVDLTILESHGDALGSVPPTYIKKNEFTASFQELVDTYGTPRYREVNPALFAVVTFPFIFGIMYGDVGHGSLLLLFGAWIIQNSEKLKKKGGIWEGFVKARYLLTAMGFFAVYAGFLYNDFLGMGMRFFSSRFESSSPIDITKVNEEFKPKPWFDSTNSGEQGKYGPYPFGLDPAWHGASNELLYVNSMKMKLSVLVGVTQMLLGVLLKFVNAWHYRNGIDFIFECIPQLTFMVAIFGYMDWMIMYKWVIPVGSDPSLSGPPSIINTLIVMGLGQSDKQPLYEGQSFVQGWLITLALIAVPLMLIPKPFLLWLRHRKSHHTSNDTVSYHALESGGEIVKPSGFDIGEVAIHQIIETIEFVLGSVSHTASYLRQWALSLAHQQLSLVFFQKTLVPALTASAPFNAIFGYLAFGVFAGITAGVLLGMDVLECFLHTLRLHWVEFQSKFYKADGWPFYPYSHRNVLSQS